ARCHLVRGSWLSTLDFGGRHVHECRLNSDARPNLEQAVDNHPLARLQPVFNSPQTIVERARANGTLNDFILIVDDVDDPLPLIVIQRTVTDQKAWVGAADGHANTGEKT